MTPLLIPESDAWRSIVADIAEFEREQEARFTKVNSENRQLADEGAQLLSAQKEIVDRRAQLEAAAALDELAAAKLHLDKTRLDLITRRLREIEAISPRPSYSGLLSILDSICGHWMRSIPEVVKAHLLEVGLSVDEEAARLDVGLFHVMRVPQGLRNIAHSRAQLGFSRHDWEGYRRLFRRVEKRHLNLLVDSMPNES